jgi:hypothetical protein
VSRVVPPALCIGTNMQGDESEGRLEDECSPATRNGAGKRQKNKAGQKMVETCSLLRSRLLCVLRVVECLAEVRRYIARFVRV